MLEVDAVDAGYGDTQILYGVDMRLDATEDVAILGANGVGKTTLLRTISGQLSPTAGSIAFKGERIDGLRPYDIAELGIAHVQQEDAIFAEMDIEDNLLVGSYLPDARERREESLELVYELFPRLEERRGQIAGTLSGGERKMLSIANGLMSRPDLLMLDEPSSGLAPNLVQEVFESIERIKAETDMPILLVEQRTREALGFADRAYVLDNGRVRAQGTTDELRSRDDIQELYLGI